MAQSPDSIALAAEAESQGIPVVLVGGNAINLYAYFRTTFDVDLLIRESDVERALFFFQGRGYEVFHRTPNFVRLRFAADPGAALPVDLMLTDKATFEKIQEQSRRVDLANGLTLPIPSALHLIAMKLHALRSPARAESGVDLLDVKHLIRSAQIDISGTEFTEIAQHYASEGIRATIEHEFGPGPET
jgi:nucleotidyltransferase AbiEii toxin of type IV toxin-antitoxin system